MQRIVVLCVIAILIIGGVVYFNSSETEMPSDEQDNDNTTSLGVPAPGSEGVDEMIVGETQDDSEMQHEGTDAGMEFPTNEEGATASMGMPVPTEPGAEPVDEMIVTEDTEMNEVQGAGAEVFNITGKNFEFSSTEIRVKEGDTVTINFTSNSGFHDWVVDEFNAATARVQAGDSSSVTFVADKTGTFEYYCSVGSHRANGMVGKLIVE